MNVVNNSFKMPSLDGNTWVAQSSLNHINFYKLLDAVQRRAQMDFDELVTYTAYFKGVVYSVQVSEIQLDR